MHHLDKGSGSPGTHEANNRHFESVHRKVAINTFNSPWNTFSGILETVVVMRIREGLK